MADAASTSTTFDTEKGQAYYGCLVRLYTKAEIRYEGFVFYLDCYDRTIGLRNVKSFGTEDRRKDGPQIPATERLSEYIYFRGSDLKDLLVLSSPSADTTAELPDDPAIIKPRSFHLPAATISLVTPSTFQAKNIDSSTQLGVQAPPFQGNLLPQSVGVSVSQASTNYWQFTGFPEGSCSQQQYLNIPQGFTSINSTQQPMLHISTNASLIGTASNVAEAPHPLLSPVSAGAPPLIATLPLPSSLQDSNASFACLFSNFTIDSKQNKASGSLPTAMVNSSREAVSSSCASPVVPPVTHSGQSWLCHPIPRTVSSTMGTSSSFDWQTSIKSFPDTQPGNMESLSSRHLQNGKNDAKIIVSSASENSEEPFEPPKAHNTEIQDSNRGHFKGRVGHGNLPNKGYQSYRSSVESGNRKIGGPLHPQHHINSGRGYVPSVAQYPHSDVRGRAYEGSSGGSLPVARLSKDFNFEKMNQRFNKEEVWDVLGKSKLSEGHDNEGNTSDAIDENGHATKVEQPIYSRDEFFDSISCRSLGARSAARGKKDTTGRRIIDVETFGESQNPQKGHSVMRPQREGRSHYLGKGSYTAERGRRANNRNQTSGN